MEGNNNSNEMTFKTIVVGDVGVGKSAISLRFCKDAFLESYTSTIGIEFYLRTIKIDDDTTIKLQLWDTAGQESFRSIIKTYYRNSSAVFIVYDITCRETFEHVSEWVEAARMNCSEDAVFVLVGNQIDRETEREVTYEEGKEIMEKYRFNFFFETSAKDGTSVEQAFTECGKFVFMNYIMKPASPTKSSPQRIVFGAQDLKNGAETPQPKKNCSC